ncbi:MAG: MCE family protein [Solirubrobacteraceae bacterium]|nr:MCE family protein [Solirubrobacteraceae bacterium]
MQKQAPTFGRLLVMVVFALSCFGLLLYLWIAFGGATPLAPKGYRFTTSFGEATQLAAEADVRISGVPVGKVKEIDTTPDGRSRTVIEMDREYAPIPRDTRAILRQKTLLGETYVELTPGDPSSGMLPEGGTLPASQVSPTVELDEILSTFDAETREAFQTWMQQQAIGMRGQGGNVNDALGNLAPFAVDTNRLLRILKAQDREVRELVDGTGRVFGALSARGDQLAQLIRNANAVFETTARRDEDLKALFRALPTFEDESERTVRRLTAFARETDPLVDQLRPAARELSPTLRQLDALAPDLNALFRDLDPLIDASERGLPAVQRFLDRFAPFLGEFDAPLRQLNPILAFLGEYRSELTAFFANPVAATQATSPDVDGNPVHYLRTINPVTPENLAIYPRRLPSNRANPYMKPREFLNLMRGMASYETRQCASGFPAFVQTSELAEAIGGATSALTALLPQPLRELDADQAQQLIGVLNSYVTPALQAELFAQAFGGVQEVIAPPCRQQGPYTTRAGTTQYPHVSAAPNGHTAEP